MRSSTRTELRVREAGVDTALTAQNAPAGYGLEIAVFVGAVLLGRSAPMGFCS